MYSWQTDRREDSGGIYIIINWVAFTAECSIIHKLKYNKLFTLQFDIYVAELMKLDCVFHDWDFCNDNAYCEGHGRYMH